MCGKWQESGMWPQKFYVWGNWAAVRRIFSNR
jgi:hypothetical protein